MALAITGWLILRNTDVPAFGQVLFWVAAAAIAIAYRPVEKHRKRNPHDLRNPEERPQHPARDPQTTPDTQNS
ncbi:hypothetical protein [Candidatus Poriferisodalis sp.]|uniref:hypothetical protein n=1 Tax=Candidatus Poriferisodalis sp. TaxID=3101277 RepID=UPI003B0276C9